MEKLDLVVNVPRAFVARCGGQETAPAACGKERLDDLITLGVGMPEIVAFVHEHEVTVFVVEIL